MKRKRGMTYLLALLPFLLLTVLFELVPLVMVVVRSFLPEGQSSLTPIGQMGFTLDHYMAIFSKRFYQQAVVNSITVSLVSAVVGIVVAFFGAKAAHQAGGKVKVFFMSVLNMTSNFAGIPLAFSFIIMLGNTGVFVMLGKKLGLGALANFNLYDVKGLALVYIYFQIPLATLLLIPAFEGIRREWQEAVSLLGGGSLDFWRRVGIPVLLPSILGTVSVLFSNAVAAYATAYALLQNNFSLLPIRISEQFVGDLVQRREFGSALAVVLMLTMIVSVTANNLLIKRARGVKR